MNKLQTTIKTDLAEEEIMQKYIVEVKAPKTGQKVSTGGVRENGKMAAQFTNPVPYIEPEYRPSVQSHTYNLKEYAKDRAVELAQNAIYDGFELLWYELLQPIIRSKFRQLSNSVVTAIESKNECISQNVTIIEEPKIKELNVHPSSTTPENIVPFPKRRIS